MYIFYFIKIQVARLDSQVVRYKTASEAAEKAEDELKLEKRKLQREVFNCLYLLFLKFDRIYKIYHLLKNT
jgi:hypothetical protein